MQVLKMGLYSLPCSQAPEDVDAAMHRHSSSGEGFHPKEMQQITLTMGCGIYLTSEKSLPLQADQAPWCSWAACPWIRRKSGVADLLVDVSSLPGEFR